MDGWMDGWMDGLMDRLMDRLIDGRERNVLFNDALNTFYLGRLMDG